VTAWRYFADREFPRVIRELGLPCAEPVTRARRCPRHQRALGPTSRMCLGCHAEAWGEVGRRYVSAEQDRGTSAKPTEADRPRLRTFPGRKLEPLPGQLELTERTG
jgi:hypothetical protein